MKRLRSLALGFVRVVLALALVLVLLEGGMRLLGIGVAERGPNNRLALRESVPVAVDPWLGEALIPGARGKVTYPAHGDVPERTVRYQISSQRLRDREFEVPKPEGVLRVACLGDSVTYGTGVEHGDTWPKQLERLLAERRAATGGASPPVEVINAGVYAMNTTQQVAWYRMAVAPLEPDVVLMVSTLPDASGHNIPAREETTSTSSGWVRRLGLTSGLWDEADMHEATPQIRRTMALRRISRLADWTAHRLHKGLMGRHLEETYRLDWERGSPGHRLVGDALDVLVELAERDGFTPVVAMYPNLVALDGDYPFAEQTEILGELCAERGISFHDLLPALQGLPAASLQVHPHDRHPNAFANAKVAVHLADIVEPLLQEL